MIDSATRKAGDPEALFHHGHLRNEIEMMTGLSVDCFGLHIGLCLFSVSTIELKSHQD